MPMHPLPIVINNGIPVALCSDDPAVFGNMGLSFDFFQVLVASEVTGLSQLGEMARDSIQVRVSVILLLALTFYNSSVLDIERRRETACVGLVGETLDQIR
jgi:hypothetical protein